jgi:hypothetical protein
MESPNRIEPNMTEHEKRERLLTAEEGFAAMFAFLNRYWEEFKTANLADVLSDLQPATLGQSSDPAAWADWLVCVQTQLANRSTRDEK